MPLVRISLLEGKPDSYKKALSDAVHRAMVETINIPEADRFQIITEHKPGHLVYDAAYLGVQRSDDIVVLQITLSAGRPLELKKALFRRIVELLKESPGIRGEDVFVNLVEVGKENWSFGNGIAQYADK